MSVKKLYDLFVGNKKRFIIWSEKEDCWKSSPFPLTDVIIRKHIRKEIAVGSYPIYKNGGSYYCKWVCVDVDAHDKTKPNNVDEEMRKEQRKFVEYLYDHSLVYLDLPQDCLLLEDSKGGYHLWIFLEEKTPLEDVGKFVFKTREPVNFLAEKFYCGEMPEFYPKQYSTDHLEKDLGNAVRLPFGRNFSKNGDCEVIKGDINSLKGVDLKPVVKGIKIEDAIRASVVSKPAKPLEKHDPKNISADLHFWLEFPIRPCFKRIISGETQCHKQSNAHQMRIAMVHECSHYGMPLEAIVKCFENQDDYKEQKTKVQIRSVLKNEDWRYSCSKIEEMGYCHDDCEVKLSRIIKFQK